MLAWYSLLRHFSTQRCKTMQFFEICYFETLLWLIPGAFVSTSIPLKSSSVLLASISGRPSERPVDYLEEETVPNSGLLTMGLIKDYLFQKHHPSSLAPTKT